MAATATATSSVALQQGQYRFHFPLQSADEARVWLEAAFGIRIADTRVCPDHATPWEAFKSAYEAHDTQCVWEASRGLGGKTYLMSALALAEATGLPANVNLLGGTGEQSARVLDAMQTHWSFERAPKHLLVGESGRYTRLTNGRWVHCLMASQASVRGPHPERLRIDEVDEVDLTILDAALGQAMTSPTAKAHTLLSSTHQYPDGTMTEVKKRAKEKGFPLFTWCYKESMAGDSGWLTQQIVDEKRRDVPQAMWDTEYELQEPSPTSRAFDPQKIRAMFAADLGLEAPRVGCRYATGADWARKNDRTAIATLLVDTKPYRLVAFAAMNRLPWPTMIGEFNTRVQAYQGTAAHDATGLGDVVHGYTTVRADPVILAGRPRGDIFTKYVRAVENGDIIAPMIPLLYAEHLYCSVDDLYGNGHPPDTVVAMALAHHAATGFVAAWA